MELSQPVIRLNDDGEPPLSTDARIIWPQDIHGLRCSHQGAPQCREVGSWVQFSCFDSRPS